MLDLTDIVLKLKYSFLLIYLYNLRGDAHVGMSRHFLNTNYITQTFWKNTCETFLPSSLKNYIFFFYAYKYFYIFTQAAITNARLNVIISYLSQIKRSTWTHVDFIPLIFNVFRRIVPNSETSVHYTVVDLLSLRRRNLVEWVSWN